MQLGAPILDNPITVQACSSVYKAHLSGDLCGIHIFRCLSEEDKQISLEIQYPEKKQAVTGCKYIKQKSLTVTQDFRCWSGLRLFREHSLLHYLCFNPHCPWRHHPDHLFSLFSSSPHGKWLPIPTKQLSSIRILCNWDPWREGKKVCNCHLKYVEISVTGFINKWLTLIKRGRKNPHKLLQKAFLNLAHTVKQNW